MINSPAPSKVILINFTRLGTSRLNIWPLWIETKSEPSLQLWCFPSFSLLLSTPPFVFSSYIFCNILIISITVYVSIKLYSIWVRNWSMFSVTLGSVPNWPGYTSVGLLMIAYLTIWDTIVQVVFDVSLCVSWMSKIYMFAILSFQVFLPMLRILQWLLLIRYMTVFYFVDFFLIEHAFYCFIRKLNKHLEI